MFLITQMFIWQEIQMLWLKKLFPGGQVSEYFLSLRPSSFIRLGGRAQTNEL